MKNKSLARLTYDTQRKLKSQVRKIDRQRGGYGEHSKSNNQRKASRDVGFKKTAEERRHLTGREREISEEDLVQEIQGTGGARLATTLRPSAHPRSGFAKLLKELGYGFPRIEEVMNQKNVNLARKKALEIWTEIHPPPPPPEPQPLPRDPRIRRTLDEEIVQP